MAIEILSHDHPLARSINLLYVLLNESENTSALVGLESAWISAIDGIKLALNPLHYSTLVFRLDYIDKFLIDRDLEHGLSILRHLLRSCDENCRGLEDIRPLVVRLFFASCLMRGCDHCEEAIIIANEMIDRSLRSGFPSKWASSFQSEAYFILGFSQMMLGQDTLSEKDMREAIRIRRTAFGARDARTLYFMQYLESYLRYWGRIEAANEVGEQWRKGLGYASDDEDSDAGDEEDPEIYIEEDSDMSAEEDLDMPDEGEVDLEE